MSARIRPTELVRARARTLGDTGERWLRDLPHLVSDLERAWGVEVRSSLGGASAGFVAIVGMSDGREGVLKVFVPQGATGAAPYRQEMLALQAAGGDPYVDVYRWDADRGAVLLERLGPPLASLGLPVDEELDIIATTLARGWGPAPDGLPNGGAKSAWLRRSIEEMWRDLESPCPRSVIDTAIERTHAREAAFDPSAAVLVHGDAHRMNVLEAGGGRFKLIDPEGLASEPEHDLAIVLRELNQQLMTGDAVELARSWCERLATGTGTRPDAIWDWAFIERVSTGLLLLTLGEVDEGRLYLAGAELLAGG